MYIAISWVTLRVTKKRRYNYQNNRLIDKKVWQLIQNEARKKEQKMNCRTHEENWKKIFFGNNKIDNPLHKNRLWLKCKI